MFYTEVEKQGTSDPDFKILAYRKEKVKKLQDQWYLSSLLKPFKVLIKHKAECQVLNISLRNSNFLIK